MARISNVQFRGRAILVGSRVIESEIVVAIRGARASNVQTSKLEEQWEGKEF